MCYVVSKFDIQSNNDVRNFKNKFQRRVKEWICKRCKPVHCYWIWRHVLFTMNAFFQAINLSLVLRSLRQSQNVKKNIFTIIMEKRRSDFKYNFLTINCLGEKISYIIFLLSHFSRAPLYLESSQNATHILPFWATLPVLMPPPHFK